MKDYKYLAMKYLKYNKKRTMLTILGVALSAMVLFAFLNSAMSLYKTLLNEAKKEVGYEVVFLCESRETAEQIAGEKCIREAKIASWVNEKTEVKYDNALYVNMEHPFQMNGYVEKITQEYGVKKEYTMLGTLYCPDGKENIIFIIGLAVLLVAYIFAIFGVAVVRNSIQLISLEQIRDYGILRCIGSTKNQLRSIVYLMGFCLEMSGIILGIVLGFGLYLLIALKAELDIGFHVIVVPAIIIVFLFDLYFVMQENCKFVNRLTPVAAVRGEFKINLNKIKAKGKSIAGILLGIEGDYAFKSLKRNPSRMWKSVGAMSMGIAMSVIALSIYGIIDEVVGEEIERYGEYQISVIERSIMFATGPEDSETERALAEHVEKLCESNKVTKCKELYETYLYTVDPYEVLEHFTQEYGEENVVGTFLMSTKEEVSANQENEALKTLYEKNLAQNRVCGYDEADYENLESVLVDGTLDISENGIVLINGTWGFDEVSETLNRKWEKYQITDYQVGDQIEFYDYQKLYELINGKYATNGTTEGWQLWLKSIEELMEQGATKTYTIEGIVEIDVNRGSRLERPAFVLPLERYLSLIGGNEEVSSGRMLHIEGTVLDSVLKEAFYGNDYKRASYVYYSYLDMLEFFGEIRTLLTGFSLFVWFVVIMNMLSIVNITASDLYLRRKEFAQLRVIGMSKRGLIRMVLLEGLIIAFLAGLIGTGVGYASVAATIAYINLNYYVPFHFSWSACLIMLVACVLIVCMMIYFPIKEMKINMAKELQTSGE